MALPGFKSIEEVKEEFPLHWHIWHGNAQQLDEALKSKLVRMIDSNSFRKQIFKN